MRKIFIIALICGMLSASCAREYEVQQSTQQRNYLPKPTRTQVDETEEGLMVLGPQLNNPYSLQTMRQARFQLLEANPNLDIPELTTTHYYVRFEPQNDDELYALLQDTTVYFYDFPLDREIISGTYYHDPAIVDSLPTYQYASIEKAKWEEMYANGAIAYTVLEELFIPEDAGDFFDGVGDGDNGGDNGGGIVPPFDGEDGGGMLPIDTTIYIPSPDPTDPPIIIPRNGFAGDDGSAETNSSGANASYLIRMLVDKAHVITGYESNIDQLVPADEWIPSGRITALDDLVNGPVPIVGAKVLARRWFTTITGFTDSNGYFTCNGSFKRPANFYIKWERGKWDIREGWFGQAYFNGPKQKSDWTLYIDGGKSLAYATIHRAAYRFFYGDNASLLKPNWGKEKIAYQHRSGSVNGRYWHEFGIGIFPDIQIFGFASDNGQRYTTTSIFNTTCHELGHAAHWTNSTFNYAAAGLTGNLKFIESWADCVAYILTNLEYQQLNFINRLHGTYYYLKDGVSVRGVVPNYINKQGWYRLDVNDENYDENMDVYTSVFIDLIDDFNQIVYKQNTPSVLSEEAVDRLPNDPLQYPISLIESLVMSSNSISGVKGGLISFYNPLFDPNSTEEVMAVLEFFAQYE